MKFLDLFVGGRVIRLLLLEFCCDVGAGLLRDLLVAHGSAFVELGGLLGPIRLIEPGPMRVRDKEGQRPNDNADPDPAGPRQHQNVADRI